MLTRCRGTWTERGYTLGIRRRAEAYMFLPSVPHGCSCSFFGDTTRRCPCTPAVMQRSMANISGPLLDRSDIHIDVPAVHYRNLSATSDGEPSAQIRQRELCPNIEPFSFVPGAKRLMIPTFGSGLINGG